VDAAENAGSEFFVPGHRSQNVDTLHVATALPDDVEGRLSIQPGLDVVHDVPAPLPRFITCYRRRSKEVEAVWQARATATLFNPL
jgi:hypothetical protein